MAQPHVPAGWPSGVRPAGSEGWERSAVGWLFDLCPPDYRAYEVLRRHPLILARFAAHCVAAGAEASRRGLGGVRAELRDAVPQEAIDAAVAAYEAEGARLLRVRREVALVTQAFEGHTFRARL